MEVFEITGYITGVSQAGVTYLQPADSFQNIENGFIYRQVLQSRQGIGYFAPRLADESRVFGIFEHTHVDGTTELLAVDQNQLYTFNTGTGVFDPIPFGGSIVGYTGFNIAAKDFYITGTSYPFANNSNRFIFCGKGINTVGTDSTIFQYDGVNVTCYTDVADNPNYSPLPGPTPLNSAEYVVWFNGRINFVAPTINNVEFLNEVLFSGIRNAAGNGDKFDVAGSGEFVADTYQYITGCSILGQILVLNFNRMTYTLEKTKDAFNPYFGRAVPGVLGTDAKFSAVSWDQEVDSLGKTGVLQTDGRQNVRCDNKIPYFTANQISPVDFNLTYGGFDRLNNQFLWAYKESGVLQYGTDTEIDTQNKVLVKNYEEDSWSVFDQRFSVFGQTDIGLNLVWDDIDFVAPPGNESWATWDTTEEIWDRIGLGEAVQKTLAGDDDGFVYELNQDFDDYITNISAIAPGATTTLTVSATAIKAGDFVTISGVTGMTEINNFDEATSEQIGDFYLVVSATNTSIVIDVDSTTFTAYISGGRLSKPISFRAETIPFNPYRNQGRRVYVSHVELLIESNGGSVKMSVKADLQDTPFIQDVLLQPSNTVEQGSEWISMSVDQEANFLTFIMKQMSPAVQLRLTSMRIYAEPGGYTSG